MLRKDLTKILFDETAIAARMDALVESIDRDHAGRDIVVIGILTGSCIFLGDILRRLTLPLTVECLSVSSYHGMQSSGMVTFRQSVMPDVAGRHVLLVDDILDTGRTLKAVGAKIRELGAVDVKSCVFLRKQIERQDVDADYVGFDIGDEFVVGYGLDYMGYYRNLPYVGVLSSEAVSRHAKVLPPQNSTPQPTDS